MGDGGIINRGRQYNIWIRGNRRKMRWRTLERKRRRESEEAKEK